MPRGSNVHARQSRQQRIGAFKLFRTSAGTGVQGWTRTACSRACCVLIFRLRRLLLPGVHMQGFRLTGLLTGLLPLVAFCILSYKQSYATFWGSNEVALQFFLSCTHRTAPHMCTVYCTYSDRHPISASLHCQLSGRPTRTAVHTSINILTVSSRFLIAYDSCQHCTSVSSRLDLFSHLLLCCLFAATWSVGT